MSEPAKNILGGHCFQRLRNGFSQGRILQGLRRISIDGVKTQRNTDELAEL